MSRGPGKKFHVELKARLSQRYDARLGCCAKALSPNHCCIDRARDGSPSISKSPFWDSVLMVANPIQIAVIVRSEHLTRRSNSWPGSKFRDRLRHRPRPATNSAATAEVPDTETVSCSV